MFIRGSAEDSGAYQATRPPGDGFVFGRVSPDGMFEAQIAPSADRAVELFAAVLEHFGPFCECVLDDWRSGQRWSGHDLATSDVRDAVARARHVVSAHAGTEITVVANGEQATLTANLVIHVFAQTDRWLYLLQGKGLRRVARRRERSWRLEPGEFLPVPAAKAAVGLLVERLRLTGVTR